MKGFALSSSPRLQLAILTLMAHNAMGCQKLQRGYFKQSLMEEKLTSCGSFARLWLQALLNELLGRKKEAKFCATVVLRAGKKNGRGKQGKELRTVLLVVMDPLAIGWHC